MLLAASINHYSHDIQLSKTPPVDERIKMWHTRITHYYNEGKPVICNYIDETGEHWY